MSDNGSPCLRSSATVVIRVLDANDNRPKFTDKLFHVKLPGLRRARGGQREVCRMVARDDDEGPNADVTYELQDDKDEAFRINPVTGEVTALRDFWPGNYSILTVGARGGGGFMVRKSPVITTSLTSALNAGERPALVITSALSERGWLISSWRALCSSQAAPLDVEQLDRNPKRRLV